MKLLFDQGTPVPLRRSLRPHDVDTAAECGWSMIENGELISEAEKAGYDAIITTDQNLKYQQNLDNRQIAIVVLKTTSWPRIQKALNKVIPMIESLKPSDYIEIEIG